MATTATRPAAKPAIRQTRLMINNEWVDPVEGGTFETFNPATGEVIAKVAAATADGRRRAVKAARKALENGPWATMDAADRGRLMFKLADLVEKNAEELAALESLNCGKTITDSRGDMQGVVNTLRYYAGWADKIEGRTVPVRGNFLSYTLRQPVGVVGQIIPWNFPLLMLAWKWGPALACGNTIVMKPAEQTPLTALRIGRAGHRGRLPAGRRSTSSTASARRPAHAMVVHPDVDKIAFTGHVDTAKIIQKAAADTLKRTHLRAGRQEPERDLRRRRPGRRPSPGRSTPSTSTAASAARPAAGCSSRRRSTRSSSSGWPRRPRSRKVGDPLDPKTEQGPQVSQEQLDKILGYVELGQKQGAKLVTGGERVGEQGLLRRADDLRQRQGRHGDRQGRDLRPGRQRAAVQGHRRSDRAGQQHLLRPGRRRLDQGHRQGPPLRQAR